MVAETGVSAVRIGTAVLLPWFRMLESDLTCRGGSISYICFPGSSVDRCLFP